MNKITHLPLKIALLSALTLTSCGEDFLDKNPKLSVTEADIYGCGALGAFRAHVSIVIFRHNQRKRKNSWTKIRISVSKTK